MPSLYLDICALQRPLDLLEQLPDGLGTLARASGNAGLKAGAAQPSRHREPHPLHDPSHAT